MSERLASCSCGQLSARVLGEPGRVSICHCLACQRRTGSVFGQQARFRRDQVQVAGRSTVYQRAGDEGPGARFHFCPQCGATLFYEPLDDESLIAIPVGAFADPGFPAPRVPRAPGVRLRGAQASLGPGAGGGGADWVRAGPARRRGRGR